MIKRLTAFTLAELLIALAILGVITTFTIPKILQANQTAKYTAIGKEVAGTVSGAFLAYKQDQGDLKQSFVFANLTPYINYASVVTTGDAIDNIPTATTTTCGGSRTCLKLHNGAMLMYYQDNFGGTTATNGIYFHVDPDGIVTDGTTNGPGKALQFWLYFNGRMATLGTISDNSCTSSTCVNPAPTKDPAWFSWN